MSELRISPAFTIDDIHKIREWHYERAKTMSVDEVRDERKKAVAWFEAEMEKRKAGSPIS